VSGIATRFLGTILLERNDEWVAQRSRCMTLETLAQLSVDPLANVPVASA
jgi:hypothetical protein